MKMTSLLLAFLFCLSLTSVHAHLLTDDLTSTTFICSDGKTAINFFDTERKLGNVKRVVVSSKKLNGTIGYVIFWSQSSSKLKGDINASAYYPELQEAEQYPPVIPNYLANVVVEKDSQGIFLNLNPIRADQSQYKFECQSK
ncbi:MAG: hypothetical protein AB7I27_01085 [Bacteriovoracaceae bacterium]